MFKLPNEVVDGIDKYKDSLKRYVSGQESAARFKGVRVPWGIYSQRKGKGSMARVRFSGGLASGSQLKAIAEAARKFADGTLHVTDRQDIQVHNLPLENTGALMDYLKKYDLSPRGGGGNTVRNITACPLAGICEKEVFDVKADAIALTEFMLKDDASYTLPRKYKVAFSGCGVDCAHATVNDLGLIAKTKGDTEGYALYVGGGLGSSSRVAKPFEGFVGKNQVIYVAEAIKRVFSAHGNRQDKHHARIRFLIEDLGLDEFKKLYRREFEKLKKEGVTLRDVKVNPPKPGDDVELGGKDDQGFALFRKHNITKQKQSGLYAVEVRIVNGDLTSDELEKIASLSDEFGGIEYRTSQRQNLVVANVSAKDTHPLYKRLVEIGFALPNASTVSDVVCCAGASTCNLGICDSKAMTIELTKEVGSVNPSALSALEGFHINVNGCPNSCGHAPIGFIGLVGSTKRIDSRMVPYYKVFLGGRVCEGKTRLNEEVGALPARNTPKAVKEFLIQAAEKASSHKDAYVFLDKEGVGLMKAIIEEHSNVPAYSEDASFYRDWGKSGDFSLAGIGTAECGAGVKEIIEADLADSEKSITTSEESLDADGVRNAIHFAARALLVVSGIDPKTPEETFEAFEKHVVSAGVCAPKFASVKESYDSLTDSSSDEEKQEKLAYAKELLSDVKEAFSLIDNHFNFRKRY